MVYVGVIFSSIPNANWRWKAACHLFADTSQELHDFALQLRLKRSWYQHKRGHLAHYDLTENKRRQAIKQGAIEADRELEVEYIRKARHELKS